uniref:C3H1-type domain-containing protein n=1 Tax=Alexandrium catenella TaxID=2925 RepID=A0A7S1Q3G5_ALECA
MAPKYLLAPHLPGMLRLPIQQRSLALPACSSGSGDAAAVAGGIAESVARSRSPASGRSGSGREAGQEQLEGEGSSLPVRPVRAGLGRLRAMPSGAGSATSRSPASSSACSLAKIASSMRITVKNTFIDVEMAGAQAREQQSLHQTGAHTCTARFSEGATPKLFPEGPGALTAVDVEDPRSPQTQPASSSTTPAETPDGGGPEASGAVPPPGLSNENLGSGKTQVLLHVPVALDAALAALLSEAPRCLGAQVLKSSTDPTSGHIVIDVRVMLATVQGASTPSGPPCHSASTSRPPAAASTAETPPSGRSEGSSGLRRLVCCHWKNKGWCRYQDNCKFLHPLHKRGVGPTGGVKSSRSTPMSKVSRSENRW